MAKKKLIILLVFIGFCWYCGQRTPQANLLEIHGNTMGTSYSVKVVLSPQETEQTPGLESKVKAEIDDLLKKINQQMSTWIEDSEISRFNRCREAEWFEVSPDTVKVVDEALQVSEKSNGAFDITVGPLVNLWGFGPGGVPGNMPTGLQITETMNKIGYRKLSLRQSPPALKKEVPGLYCDLSAIAKGFGVDKVAEYLETRGFSHYLVEIGGEVRAKGARPDREPWRVAIISPGLDGNSPYQKIILLQGMSMATSGDYFNYFEKGGVRYSHTIDPTTGRPITHKLASVTVVHKNCMTADALATAIDVMGPEKGYELALKDNLPVFMIVRGAGGFVEKTTPAFEKIQTK